MGEHITSPGLVEALNSTRTENDVRDLAKAKVRAQQAWDDFCAKPRSGLTEDQAIEREIESKRLCRALNEADYALHRAMAS